MAFPSEKLMSKAVRPSCTSINFHRNLLYSSRMFHKAHCLAKKVMMLLLVAVEEVVEKEEEE